MVNLLMFDGLCSADLGVNVSSKRVYDGSQLDYSVQQIPGRNGDLLFSNGRKQNVEISYTLMWRNNIVQRMNSIREWLFKSEGKYCHLEDSYDPNCYRLAYFTGQFSPEPFKNKSGTVEVAFSCKPQRFLKTGEEIITVSKDCILKNPGSGEAKPILKIYGTGIVTISDYVVEVKEGGTNFVELDCERMTATEEGESRESNIVVRNGTQNHVFPSIPSGDFHIQIGSGITKLEITPRWWML